MCTMIQKRIVQTVQILKHTDLENKTRQFPAVNNIVNHGLWKAQATINMYKKNK